MPPCDLDSIDTYLQSLLSFNPCFDGCRPATCDIPQYLEAPKIGFNPCFDGCRPATCFGAKLQIGDGGFNPCFDGCRPATKEFNITLMDVS